MDPKGPQASLDKPAPESQTMVCFEDDDGGGETRFAAAGAQPNEAWSVRFVQFAGWRA